MTFIDAFAIIPISLGAFFLMVGSIGLLRLPDFFSRTHATGKADTLGILLIITGLVIIEVQYGNWINSAKLLIIIGFVALTNPTATNALARAAYKMGLKPWFKDDKSKKEEEKE